jgi:hypothetical protein
LEKVMRVPGIAAVGAVLAMLAGVAEAQIHWLESTGAWRSYGGLSDQGTPVCGMRVLSGERAFHVKYFGGNDFLTVQVFKDSWRIPANTDVRVRYGVDGDMRWYATALGQRDFIEWRIDMETMREFERSFRLGNRLEIVFPDGNETGWMVSLRGSNAITSSFVRCLGIMQENGLIPSRPRGSGTQPFGTPSRPPAPTQPFTPRRST